MTTAHNFEKTDNTAMPRMAVSKSAYFKVSIEEADKLVRLGNSGWIGYDFFCEYSSAIDSRHSRLSKTTTHPHVPSPISSD